jgi:hypothetical protein
MTAVPGGPVDGPVDPLDAAQVAPVLAGTRDLMGTAGLADLLGRLPGAVHRPGRPGRLLRAASPEAVWLGPEDLLELTEPPVHRHVVGGVVLQRTPLTPAQLGPSLARLVVALVGSQGAVAEATTVLTAARDVLARL